MNLFKNFALMTMLFSVTTISAYTENMVNKKIPALSVGLSVNKIKKITLKNGTELSKYEEHYKGVPIFAYNIVSVKEKNKPLFWRGKLLNDLNKDVLTTKPFLSKQKVIGLLVKEARLTTDKIYQEKAKLFLYKDDYNKIRLAYLTSVIMYGNKPTKPTAFIDAMNGKVIKHWEGLNTDFKAIGPGGNTKTGKHMYGIDYQKLFINDDCQFWNEGVVKTVNLAHQTAPNGGSIMKLSSCSAPFENTYKEINGAFSPANDAHAFGHVVFNLFKDWYGVTPLDTALTLRVHYSRNYENAFWDGQTMTFGDGATRFYPLVSLDVTAHEVAHGFTQKNSDLVYSRQSGGMNESFSDISGEAAEYYFRGEKENSNDWLVGGDIFKGPKGKAARYFEEPEKDGRSIGHADKYVDGMDVHYSSGVYNRAFYLLSHMKGWNVRKAYDVFVLANQIYWSANENFRSGACKLKTAAIDLKYNPDDIIKAFDTVGVDASCGPEIIEIKSGDIIKELSGEKNKTFYFYINVPSHAYALNIESFDGEGDVDMYVRKDKKPTKDYFDCRSYDSAQKKQLCHIPYPKPTRYYVLVNGYSAFKNISIKASVY